MSRLIVSGGLAPLLRSWAYMYSYIPRQKSREEIIQVCASQFGLLIVVTLQYNKLLRGHTLNALTNFRSEKAP